MFMRIITAMLMALALAFGWVLIDHAPDVVEWTAPQVECESECMCFDCYWRECYGEAADEFDALFDALEFKVARNGQSMIKRPNESYRFVKMN